MKLSEDHSIELACRVSWRRTHIYAALGARSGPGEGSACEIQLLLRGERVSHEDVVDMAAV